MRLSSTAVLLFIAALPIAAAVRAPREMRQTVSPAIPKSGVRAELLHDLDDMQKKILSLAMAMPAEKYAWRPVRGVRSVSEVCPRRPCTWAQPVMPLLTLWRSS